MSVIVTHCSMSILFKPIATLRFIYQTRPRMRQPLAYMGASASRAHTLFACTSVSETHIYGSERKVVVRAFQSFYPMEDMGYSIFTHFNPPLFSVDGNYIMMMG